MNPAKFQAALSEIGDWLREERAVRAAAVYGSVARGEATHDSDLDLIIVLKDEREERAVADRVRTIAGAHDVAVSVLAVDRNLDQLTPQMRETIARQAVLLKGRLAPQTLQSLMLLPMRIVRYSFRGLSPARKSKISELLYGYETRKRVGRRTYVTKRSGLVAELGGRRLGAGAILVPESNVGEVVRALRAHGAKRTLIPVWVQAP